MCSLKCFKWQNTIVSRWYLNLRIFLQIHRFHVKLDQQKKTVFTCSRWADFQAENKNHVRAITRGCSSRLWQPQSNAKKQLPFQVLLKIMRIKRMRSLFRKLMWETIDAICFDDRTAIPHMRCTMISYVLEISSRNRWTAAAELLSASSRISVLETKDLVNYVSGFKLSQNMPKLSKFSHVFIWISHFWFQCPDPLQNLLIPNQFKTAVVLIMSFFQHRWHQPFCAAGPQGPQGALVASLRWWPPGQTMDIKGINIQISTNILDYVSICDTHWLYIRIIWCIDMYIIYVTCI